MNFVVGLTGGIGSGKSTVAAEFEKLGITVVDADIAARAVVTPGSEALPLIRAHFGDETIQTDGTVNRAALRSRIFQDDTERRWLEALLHPLIRQWILDELAKSTSPYSVLASPLLFETDQHTLVNRSLVIDIPVEEQIRRSRARDQNSRAQIEAIIRSQMPREERVRRADDVLDNQADQSHLASEVARLDRHYRELASTPS